MAIDRPEEESNEDVELAESSSENEVAEDIGIPPEVLEELPEQRRRRITQYTSMLAQFAGPVFNPVLRRVTPEHITQILANSEAQNQRDAEANKSHRRYNFLYFLATLIALLAVLFFFGIREQYDLLLNIAIGILGFGGGFGVGKLTGRR